MTHRQGPYVASNGFCALCKGTHYGTRDCPYSCSLCDVNTEPCARDGCPRNARWARELADADRRRVTPGDLEYASWSQTSGVPVPAKDVLPPKCAGCETRCSGCPMSHPDSTRGVQPTRTRAKSVKLKCQFDGSETTAGVIETSDEAQQARSSGGQQP